jgi:rubredoxin
MMNNKSWWICSECDYIMQAENPPQECPQCKKKCIFSDVTCYIPECGGPNNPDVRLIALKNAESNRINQQ